MSADLFSLSGRRALVTGADAGIGRALALGLAAQGADLVLHHLDNASGAAALAREIVGSGGQATVVQADFSEPSAATRVATDILAQIGPVDILIANAALERRRSWETVTPADVDVHVAVNFTAVLMLIEALVPTMAERGWGRVIALGSVLATRPRAETVVYAALKSALITAIRAIARDVARHGVTMNVISPGAIETERTAERYADADFRRAVVAKIPAGRHGQPGDCVGPVVMLCGKAGDYVTGAEIPVDGGWSIGDSPGVLPQTMKTM